MAYFNGTLWVTNFMAVEAWMKQNGAQKVTRYWYFDKENARFFHICEPTVTLDTGEPMQLGRLDLEQNKCDHCACQPPDEVAMMARLQQLKGRDEQRD